MAEARAAEADRKADADLQMPKFLREGGGGKSRAEQDEPDGVNGARPGVIEQPPDERCGDAKARAPIE